MAHFDISGPGVCDEDFLHSLEAKKQFADRRFAPEDRPKFPRGKSHVTNH